MFESLGVFVIVLFLYSGAVTLLATYLLSRWQEAQRYPEVLETDGA